jgi:hypothetical protein
MKLLVLVDVVVPVDVAVVLVAEVAAYNDIKYVPIKVEV